MPPIFGRAAITLGIGPHSSFLSIVVASFSCSLFSEYFFAVLARTSVRVVVLEFWTWTPVGLKSTFVDLDLDLIVDDLDLNFQDLILTCIT